MFNNHFVFILFWCNPGFLKPKNQFDRLVDVVVLILNMTRPTLFNTRNSVLSWSESIFIRISVINHHWCYNTYIPHKQGIRTTVTTMKFVPTDIQNQISQQSSEHRLANLYTIAENFVAALLQCLI